MARSTTRPIAQPLPALRDVVELAKPITWFPPVWAFLCGAVSAGVPLGERWALVVAGMLLAGPLVCGTSQAINDWFDRHVDAINEPHRPIPSGRIAGRWGLVIAVAGSAVSAGVGWAMGPWVFAATLLALALAWGYSAPPLRWKANALLGPAAVAFSYEGLTWFTGAALMLGAFPDARVVAVLLLYAAGAHGIMTLNDFKAVEGDRATGVRSLPVLVGTSRAVRIACVVMAVPQLVVAALLASWGLTAAALLVAVALVGQLVAMRRLLADPRGRAPWYNGVGVTLYVLGMMAAACGLGGVWAG